MIVTETRPKGPTGTLYDLLGARPDDDAEGVRHAFRKVMASRPGFHARDPDAPERFRRLVEAYDILRDAERRAAYDRQLEFERGQVYSKLKRAVSYVVHNIVFDAISVAGLVVVLAGGHTLFAYISMPPVNAVEATARRPAEAAGFRSAGTGIIGLDQPRENERVTSAETDHAFVARTDRHRAQPGEVQSQKKDHDVPKSSFSELAKSDDKPDTKIPDTRNFNTHDTKIPETKITGKPRVEAKREVRNHDPVKQASLENTKTITCSDPQACLSEPPVFGVGF
jgi:curved DNA-binding protein CbpA